MTTLNEGMHDGEFIGELAMGVGFHVDPITLLSGQNLVAGAAIGAIPAGTSASAAKSGGNTGNGTFVLDATTPILPRAIEGVYTLRCITAVTNGGVFRLENPLGVVLGDFTITPGAGGTVTVSDQIKGVLTDGATDFIVGDGFDITISALTYKYAEYNPAGTNGTQIIAGLLYKNTNATSADTATTALLRGPASVNANDIGWKTGMTTAQKTFARGELLKLGIKAA
jgi:hypothetical protein